MKKLFSMMALFIVSIAFLGVVTVNAAASSLTVDLDLSYYKEVELNLNNTSDPLVTVLGSLVVTTSETSFWTFDDTTLSQGYAGQEIKVTYDSSTSKAVIKLNTDEPQDGEVVKNLTYNGHIINLKYGYVVVEIDKIYVSGINKNLTGGLIPKIKDEEGTIFTATSQEESKYYIYLEQWISKADGKGFASSAFFNDDAHTHNGEKLLTKFESGETYTYGIWVKPRTGYKFTDNVQLIIDGGTAGTFTYDATRDSINDEAGVWFYPLEVAIESSENIDYKIIDGANQSYIINSNKDLTIRANGEFIKFVGIEVDGVSVSSDKYTAVSGSTIITLKPEYLSTLSVGTHTMKILYNDGDVNTNFTIVTKETTNNPQTLDNISWFITLGSISLIGLLTVGLYYLRKKMN